MRHHRARVEETLREGRIERHCGKVAAELPCGSGLGPVHLLGEPLRDSVAPGGDQRFANLRQTQRDASELSGGHGIAPPTMAQTPWLRRRPGRQSSTSSAQRS